MTKEIAPGLFLAQSNAVQKDGFVIARTGHIKAGDKVTIMDNDVEFASVDGSLADRLIALGLAHYENQKGNDAILIVHEGTEVRFPDEPYDDGS